MSRPHIPIGGYGEIAFIQRGSVCAGKLDFEPIREDGSATS